MGLVAASDALSKEFLEPTIAGDMVACIGVSEVGAGSDVSGIRTTARRVSLVAVVFVFAVCLSRCIATRPLTGRMAMTISSMAARCGLQTGSKAIGCACS